MNKSPLNSNISRNASVHLDALRGLAALTVFLSHGRSLFLRSGLRAAIVGASALNTAPTSSESVTRPSIGHFAVVAFFVLSGYFVGGSVTRAFRKGSFLWSKYLFQRMTRLWVVLIPALLLGWTLDAVGIYMHGSAQSVYSGPLGTGIPPGIADHMGLGVLLGNALFLQGIFTPMLGSNQPLWSLAYELWFYILFPLGITVVLGKASTTRRIISAICFVALATMCGPKLMGGFLVWLLGVVVALIPLRSMARYFRAVVIGGIALVLGTAFFELRQPLLPIMADLLFGVSVAVLVGAMLHAPGSTLPQFYRTSASRLSAMSYTLYVLHVPVLMFISAFLMPVWRPWSVSISSLAEMSVILLFVLTFSWVWHFCFERNTEWVRSMLLRTTERLRSARLQRQVVAVER